MKSLMKKQQPDTLEAFLARVEEFTNNLTKLENNVVELKLVQTKVLSEPSASERQKHLTKQNNLVKENKMIGSNLQKQIKEEKARVDKLVKHQDGSAEIQIRKTQMQASSKRFLDIWTDYNNTQLEFRDKNKKVLIRNIKIIDPSSNITNEEIEEKLEAGDLTVLSSIVKETAQAKEDLKQLEGRHSELIKLEKGITEVHEMFLDLSAMLEVQGEAVTRIGHNVEAAAESAAQARTQLHQAEKKKKAARRMKLILAAILSGVAVVVALILAILL